MSPQALAGQPLEARLENVPGSLVDGVPQLAPNTIQHADQIMTERRTNPGLRDDLFCVADGAVYTVKDGKPILYLTRGAANPILKNPHAAANQLLSAGHYVPSGEDVSAALSSPDTLEIPLLGTGLKRYNDRFSYIDICTGKPDNPNPLQRRMAERVHGQGEDFHKSMGMLDEAQIPFTRMYVPNPEYIKRHVREGSAVALACRLDNFAGGSVFYAFGGGVASNEVLRGARR